MIYTVVGDVTQEINLAPATVAEEVLQNVAILFATPKYTVPLDRNFGLSQTFIDVEAPRIAQAAIIAELYDAVEEYEPRAKIINIEFTGDAMKGRLVPRAEVEIDG